MDSSFVAAVAADARSASARRVIALLMAAAVLLSGCVSMKTVALPAPGQPAAAVAVKVGDRIQIGLRTGETFLLKVTAVETEALVGRAEASGQNVRIAYADIAKLQVQRMDAARTSLAGVGTVLIIIGVAAAVFLLGGGMHLNLMGA